MTPEAPGRPQKIRDGVPPPRLETSPAGTDPQLTPPTAVPEFPPPPAGWIGSPPRLPSEAGPAPRHSRPAADAHVVRQTAFSEFQLCGNAKGVQPVDGHLSCGRMSVLHALHACAN